jgi:hypothetical protein
MRCEASLANRKLQYRGFAPRIAVGSVDHRLNMPFDAFTRRSVHLGLRREF